MVPPSLLFAELPCPWCGELLELTIDPGNIPAEYVEDCHVCCAPIVVHISDPHDPSAMPEVRLEREGY